MTASDATIPGNPGKTVPLLLRGRWYVPRDVLDVTDGWQLSMAPLILIQSTIGRGAVVASDLPVKERVRILRDAVRLFAGGTVDLGSLGRQSPAEFAAAMRGLVGLPTGLVRRWARMLEDLIDDIAAPATLHRRSLISLPANTFTCLDAVCRAATDSDEIWIRPSRREPVSALRFVAALLQSGWPPDSLSLVGTEQLQLRDLVRLTDRQVVFGGAELAAALGSAVLSPTLEFRGPGRGLALLPQGVEPDRAAEWLLPLVAADGGRFCRNVCTIVSRDDPAPVAQALARRLDAIDLRDEDAAHPQGHFHNPAEAAVISRSIEDVLASGDVRRTGRELVQAGRDGEIRLSPTLVELAHPGFVDSPHPLLARELPFPFASISYANDGLIEHCRSRSLFVYEMA